MVGGGGGQGRRLTWEGVGTRSVSPEEVYPVSDIINFMDLKVIEME